MKSFNHVNAKTVNEAVRLLKGGRGKVKVIAGGTDLLGVLKDQLLPAYPETIVNLKTVQKLNYIKEDRFGLKIGAMAKLEDIANSPLIKKNYSIISEAAQSVATPQIRGMATIGGNICQDVRCWYYRYPNQIGGRVNCYLKGGGACSALIGDNRYHSIFGGMRNSPPPCQSSCPGGIFIPSYMNKLREGDIPAAAMILLENNPIPSITGRVCPHFCQQSCNRSGFDESVSVRDVERFLGDYILENDLITPPKKETGKSVAIVGSGPAGLAAAYYLRMAGHHVVVFERMEKAGGLLQYVIPAYRLPKDIVVRTVKALEKAGVIFKLKQDIGKKITIKQLKKEYDAVFIATGSWNPVKIGLDGEESTRFGMDFLKEIQEGLKKAPGKQVLVIGGGNAAIDVATSALRLGASKATMACLEKRDEMPAFPWEVEQALEEGVQLLTSWGPGKVLKSGNKVTHMQLVSCTSVYNAENRFAPTYDKSKTMTVEADVIMMAVGYSTDLDFVKGILEISRGLLTVNGETQETSLNGVYAGGAVSHGPATVIEAIASGKRAVASINATFDAGLHNEKKRPGELLKFDENCCQSSSKLDLVRVPVKDRTITKEDVPGPRLSQVEVEAKRCFNCSCLSVNASDMAVVLTALDAAFKVTGTKGSRVVPVDEFFKVLRNTLEPDEIITEIQVPRQDGASQSFTKFRLRDSIDFAVVSLAVIVKQSKGIVTESRIALGSVAPVPLRARKAERVLIGKSVSAKSLDAIASEATSEALAFNKNKYKTQIIKELIRKSISG